MKTARSGPITPPINRGVLREVAAWKLRELLYFAGGFWQFLAIGLINEQVENANAETSANDLAHIRMHAYQFLVHWAGWERYCQGLQLDPIAALDPGVHADLLGSALAMAQRYTVDAAQITVILSSRTPAPFPAPTARDVLAQIGQEYQRRYELHHAAKPGRQHVGRQN